MENNDIALKIAEVIIPHRKRSERFVGFIPYTLQFEIRKYHGVSKKPQKVGILDKTIINLIGRGLTNIDEIAKHLGFDTNYDLEKDLLSYNVDYIRNQLQLITGRNKSLALTADGQQLYKTGECLKTFSNSFELYVDPIHPYFPFLKECIAELPGVKKQKKTESKENLNLPQIKFIAEQQASHVQYMEGGIELVEAQLLSINKANIDLYICFLQSLRDNTIRTIAYDDVTGSVIQTLSSLFDGNDKLRESLLKECLANEVKEENAISVPYDEKSEEQIADELQKIKDADDLGEEIGDNEDERKVGSIFDSAEFEKELQNVFESHQNEEIWLISPWIRKYAFLRSREPKIRKFLDQGGTVFIGYSEPERLGEEMVDPDSMAVVKRLDAKYDKFYYAELPKFHYKNVIEYKKGITTLYTGSFNVLSFCINDSMEHYRMEQMMLANEESAIKTRRDYLSLFAKQYTERYVVKLGTAKEGTKFKAPKLKYLDNCDVLHEWYHLLSDKAAEKSITIDMSSASDMTTEELISLAQRITSLSYQDDPDYIQAFLSADLYLFEQAKSNSNVKLKKLVEKHLFQIVQRKSIYNQCRFILSKGYDDKKKSVIRIILNGLNFEFGEIALPSNVFNIINRHKEYIDLRAANVKGAKFNIVPLLYNSSKILEER